MIDYNDIKQTIAENLPDNNRREITAARLRDTLDGFVDKVQVTENGLEGRVSVNETNIGNLSGRVDSLSLPIPRLNIRCIMVAVSNNWVTGRIGIPASLPPQAYFWVLLLMITCLVSIIPHLTKQDMHL